MNSKELQNTYDVIVVGGGHAGCEATLSCARRGLKTLLLTHNIDQIAAMSCNPAIGGLGKGHLVKEIDALGGEMAKNIDETGIQFRRLNTAKGPAVQGTRAQADKYLYKTRMRYVIQCQENVDIKQAVVKSIIVNNGAVRGVNVTNGTRIFSKTVILTTGTFLRGLCHVGLKNFPGGRAGDEPAYDLSTSLMDDCGLELMRLKTGTVPRLDKKTIDFSTLEEQKGDFPLPLFSFTKTMQRQRQVSCFITYTNQNTHDIIKQYMDQSPLYQGIIKGTGPRYCPSIEDKITRFADKDRHQIFLEPEGLTTNEIYPNGLSTSLPLEAQIKFIRSIQGCENAEITRPGYAVEYDAASPLQLKMNYETKNVSGLFLAGQINGTTGYEEAAVQGLLAGINAGQYFFNLEPFILNRSEAYAGVLTDDLMTKGVGGEPYRMFTSRAEYRLMLREDNADIRLKKKGYELNLITENEYRNFQSKVEKLDNLKRMSTGTKISIQNPKIQEFILKLGRQIPENLILEQFIKWPNVKVCDFQNLWDELPFEDKFDFEIINLLFSDIKYQGYIQRYDRQIQRMKHYDQIKIPKSISYDTIASLSSEVKEKLKLVNPQTLGSALRIPGVTPAAIAHLEIFISKR